MYVDIYQFCFEWKLHELFMYVDVAMIILTQVLQSGEEAPTKNFVLFVKIAFTTK